VLGKELAEMHPVFIGSCQRIGAEPQLAHHLAAIAEKPCDRVGVTDVEQQPVLGHIFRILSTSSCQRRCQKLRTKVRRAIRQWSLCR